VGELGAKSNGAALIGLFYAERNREYPIRMPVMSVGRASDNTLRIRDERIAAHHVRIERDGQSYVVEVAEEQALTTVNGLALRGGDRRKLDDGDLLCLSDLEFRFASDRRDGLLGRLWVVSGVHRGKIFRIDRSEVSIGRATDNDVQFPDQSVSRHHCRLQRTDAIWLIEDLGSTNGTLVDGAPLQSRPQLTHSTEITAGFSRFVFQEMDEPLVNLKLEPLPPCN
jgi:pSer/pThr/pTyr-binding forkhead associated (FHA) protein